MDANDIINALNRVLDLGDQLDNAGGGVKGLTDGAHTTREVCKIELGQFLLYLANCSSFINEGQAAVLNLVLGDGFSEIPAYKLKNLASSISAPDPSDNVTLSAFMQADMALSRQNGNSSSSLTNILISIYKAFGQLLIAMNENAMAHNRYDGFINRLESRASIVGYSNNDSDSSSSMLLSDDDFEIDDDVLTQYTGNDTHVVVPDGVERIGDNAFSDKTSIQTITLPDSVTAIGESAFRHCDDLESINLPEGITEIESDAFTYCDSLTSLDIPSTVDTIGGDAFCFCNHIKRIRIPSTLTDIGDDAFKYCSGLETVIIYGGRKRNSVLERLKDHFPARARIVWEGDEIQKTKTAATAKKSTGKKSTTKKASKSSGKYNDRVSFDLPDGYEFGEEKNDDGERTVKISVNPSLNDGGETVYESTFIINILTQDNVSATKSALDIIEEKNKECIVNRRLTSTPEALITISSNTSSILGVQFTLKLINLAIALSSKETVLITCIKSKAGEDEESIQPALDQLVTVWKSMSIDGKKVTAADMNIESLMATITEKEDADKEKGESPIDNHVQQDGNYLVIGNRWRLELPYGIRYRLRNRSENERFDVLLFELDRRTIGNCFLGKTLKEQQDATHTILLVLSLHGGGFEDLYKVHVRNNEVIDVQLGLKLSNSGKTAFEITVTEKEHAIETRIMMIPPCEIENKEEAFKKLGDGDFSTEHPLGYAWEQYWKIAVRLASSISSLSDTQSDLPLSPVEQIEGGFSVQMPTEVKSIKIKDTKKIAYLPTTKNLTQNSLKHLDDYPYSVVLETGKMDLPSADPEDNQQMPCVRSMTSKILCNALERKLKEAFAVVLCESVSDSGYKAIYLTKSGSSLAPDIFVLTNDGQFASFQFRSGSEFDPGKTIQIAKTVFENIHYPNDEEITPIAYPQVPDICHEHLTLMLGGSYTTRRDADFVGQPIRMLMEKCGNTKEEAYDLMQIPNDDYDLDTEARRLAKVFRLEEGMFDPYTDTEAMIRLGMFSDARMFHALRSLAWTVSCKADREGRNLDSYTYEELVELGKPIDNNHFNYSTESYCSGLCSHYDWRVFYVPDAYLDSDCESSTDLRTLCGKENRSGNSSFVVMGALGGFSAMNRTSDIISRNEETVESLEALRKDLNDLLPIMKTIYNGLMENRNREEKLEGVLPDALNAWCALAVAAREPFYSEEANDNPEVEAGLSGPMEQPTDDFENRTPKKNTNSTHKQTTLKKPSRPVPKGDVLDLAGATVIKPGQFAGNLSLRNIIIPEGVTEIGEQAFYSCMFLETVVLPKSLKKIGKMAFMSCRSLRQVEIPEGVKVICDHAFGATNNLKEVHLPDSLQCVDRYIFGFGGDSPYATAYMSGELASRLQSNSNDARFLSAISARRYVIDGVGYENLYDYGRPSISSSGVVTGIENKSFDRYRAEMEKACKNGKLLQDMIEAGRKAVYADPNAEIFGYKDAFEQAVNHLDRDATVVFSGKHFVLTGFGEYEKDVIAQIEKRGGIIHSSMVKMADYLIVCLESPGAAKIKKALEWRQKGANNLIISDYQMWQAFYGKPKSDPSGRKLVASQKPVKQEAANTGIGSTRKRRTQGKKMSELEEAVNSSVSELAQASENESSAEEREAVQKAQSLLADMQSQVSSTNSALEKHQENLRKQQEEKERRMEEAKKKGKSGHDETDMLAVLLVEEALGQLNRDENEFAQTYAEDFAAYNEQQLIRLRRKVLPTIHNAGVIESAKEDMLARPLEDRFSISTANYFNVSTDWDFDAKGVAAIETTKLWYNENEMAQLRQRMEEHKQKTRQSVFSQLTTFRSEWSDFFKSKGDLIISIEESDEPVPEAHSLFHVILRSNVHVRISLSNPSVGYLTIPVMNVFASCWKVSPEAIWDAALKNKIDDNRGTAYSSQSDVLSAKAKALAPLKPVTEPSKKQEPWVLKRNEEADKNKKRKDEIRQEISRLQAERDSTGGLFGVFKRKKIQKQIDELYDEMHRL